MVTHYEALLAWRFLTGVCLAGIYPVGMKIAAQWYTKGLGAAQLGARASGHLGGAGHVLVEPGQRRGGRQRRRWALRAGPRWRSVQGRHSPSGRLVPHRGRRLHLRQPGLQQGPPGRAIAHGLLPIGDGEKL